MYRKPVGSSPNASPRYQSSPGDTSVFVQPQYPRTTSPIHPPSFDPYASSQPGPPLPPRPQSFGFTSRNQPADQVFRAPVDGSASSSHTEGHQSPYQSSFSSWGASNLNRSTYSPVAPPENTAPVLPPSYAPRKEISPVDESPYLSSPITPPGFPTNRYPNTYPNTAAPLRSPQGIRHANTYPQLPNKTGNVLSESYTIDPLIDTNERPHSRGPARNVNSDDLPRWRPRSIAFPWFHSFVLFNLLCGLIYLALGLVLNAKQGYIAVATSNVNWIFLFGPLVLAQIISEWIKRLIVDFELVKPYWELSDFTLQKKRGASTAFKKALLPKERFAWNGWRPKVFWRNIMPNTSLNNLSYLVALIFVPFMATVFHRSQVPITKNSVQFTTVSAKSLLKAYNGSTFGPPILQSIYHGVRGANTGLKTSLWSVTAYVPGVASAFITPFFPVDDVVGRFPVLAAASWQSSASVIATGMNCSEVTNIEVIISGSANASHTVKATLKDRNNCVFVHNQTIAIPSKEGVIYTAWDQLEGHDKNSPSSCSRFRNFAFAGYLYPESFTSSSNTIDTSKKGKGAFGAIPCDPYFVNYENVETTVDRNVDSLNAVTLTGNYYADFSSIQSTSLPGLTDVFRSQMSSTLFLGNLTKDLVDPVAGKTFWGSTVDTAYEGWDGFDSTRSWSCASVKDFGDSDWIESQWTGNEQACKLYGGVKGIYVIVASWTASAVAQFIPADQSTTRTGSMTFVVSVWVLDKPTAIAAAILHAFIVLYLVSIAYSLRRRITGLYGNPGSIASKMFYFRDTATRDLFKGLDAFPGERSLEILRERLDDCRFKWAIGEQTPRSGAQSVFIKGTQVHDTGSAWDEPEDPSPDYAKRFTMLPLTMEIWFIAVMLVIIAGLLAFIFAFILAPRGGNGLPVLDRVGSSIWYSLLYWINTHAFSWGSILTLTALGMWWGAVDTFFRQAQPFEELQKPARGTSTLCTQYLTQPDISVTLKAVRKKHWKLAYVTLITFSVKVAVVAAGTLFEVVKTSNVAATVLNSKAAWRDTTFKPIVNESMWENIQEATISSSLMGFPKQDGWVVGSHSFLPIVIPKDNVEYVVDLQAISSTLQCSPVQNTPNPNVSTGFSAWSFTIANGTCKGASVRLCDEVQSSSATASSGGCYTWRLLPPSDCNGAEDSWLIISASTTSLVNVSSTGATSQMIFASQPSITTILCRPEYTKDTIQTSIKQSAGVVTLTPRNNTSSTPLSPSQWTSNGTNFSAYFSHQLNASTLIKNVYLASSGVAVDPISAIMAFNVSSGISSLQSPTFIFTPASLVYGAIFAAYAANDFVFDSKPTSAPLSLPASISTTKRRALPRRGSIYFVIAALALLGVSLVLLLWWRDGVMLPQDVSCLGGQMILLCDNSVIRGMERYERRWESLRERDFALGIIDDPARGGRHLGVDGAENVVLVRREKVKKG